MFREKQVQPVTCACDCIHMHKAAANACKSGILYCMCHWYHRNLSVSKTSIEKNVLHSSYWLTNMEAKKVENKRPNLLYIVLEDKRMT